ncbi:MAG: hypothetical protein AAB669_01375 [Patescibacteria group bacterium]
MPRAPRPTGEISTEGQQLFEQVCKNVDDWLQSHDNGEQHFHIDTGLKSLGLPHVEEKILRAYRDAGWSSATFFPRGPDSRDRDTEKKLYLVLERARQQP